MSRDETTIQGYIEMQMGSDAVSPELQTTLQSMLARISALEVGDGLSTTVNHFHCIGSFITDMMLNEEYQSVVLPTDGTLQKVTVAIDTMVVSKATPRLLVKLPYEDDVRTFYGDAIVRNEYPFRTFLCDVTIEEGTVISLFMDGDVADEIEGVHLQGVCWTASIQSDPQRLNVVKDSVTDTLVAFAMAEQAEV